MEAFQAEEKPSGMHYIMQSDYEIRSRGVKPQVGFLNLKEDHLKKQPMHNSRYILNATASSG